MRLSDMLQSPLITDDNWKRKLAKYFQEIEQLGAEAMKQTVKKSENLSSDDGKTVCVDFYDKNNNHIISCFYNKATGNREKIVFTVFQITIEMRFDESVHNSDQYLDCGAVAIYDARPNSPIKKMVLFLNGDGTISFGSHIIAVCLHDKKILAYYNADGVLQPNGISKGFSDADNKKIIQFHEKYRFHQI